MPRLVREQLYCSDSVVHSVVVFFVCKFTFPELPVGAKNNYKIQLEVRSMEAVTFCVHIWTETSMSQ